MAFVSSFVKRFAVKFLEVIGAGIATAVTGYLLAHFSGYWSAPAPAAVQVAPNTSVAPKAPRAQPAQSARTTVNTSPAAAARKQVTTEASAAESKGHDMQSVEAQVRAALANVDASRPLPQEAQPRQADSPPAPAANAVQPDDAHRGPDATPAPRPADETPQPAQQTAAPSEPLPTFEIKSRPVAAVEPSPSPAAQDDIKETTKATAKEADASFLSAIKKIPEWLRGDTPAADGEPPRPPRPVGQ